MTPFFILLGSWTLFRILGWLGLRYLKGWDQAGATALAVTFGFTGVTRFSSMAGDYMAIIPPPLPRSIWVIYVTGGLELIGAVGLLSRRRRSQAGRCLIALLVAMYPANAYAALAGIPFRGEPPTPLAIRAAIQLGFRPGAVVRLEGDGFGTHTAVYRRRVNFDGAPHLRVIPLSHWHNTLWFGCMVGPNQLGLLV